MSTQLQLTDISYQMEFHPKRFTMDKIFIIRQIFKKCYEHNIDMHNIFVDYMLAFDSVYRNKIIQCLAQDNVPVKLMRLAELTLINTRARVKINNEYTEAFKVESGVNQGDTLAATLFSVLVDVVLKQLDLRGNIPTSLKQCSANADDILITTKTKQ